MKLSKEEIHHVAHLSRLEFDDKEGERIAGDMNSILDYIDKLKKLDTDGVEPTSHAVPVTNAFREDELKESLPDSEGIKNAPYSEDGSFKVPKVIE